MVAPAEPVEAQKDPPKENQVAAAPVPSDNTARPSESEKSDAAANPATGNGTVMPAEPQKDPVKDTQVSETPAADSNANKPDETTGSNVAANPQMNGGTAIPAEPQKEPPKETQVASLPEADKPVASNSGTGAPNDVRVPNNPPASDGADSGNVEGSKPPPTGELSAKPTIEIVLKNGRVLRVEEDIDPAVLSRLIALIEK